MYHLCQIWHTNNIHKPWTTRTLFNRDGGGCCSTTMRALEWGTLSHWPILGRCAFLSPANHLPHPANHSASSTHIPHSPVHRYWWGRPACYRATRTGCPQAGEESGPWKRTAGKCCRLHTAYREGSMHCVWDKKWLWPCSHNHELIELVQSILPKIPLSSHLHYPQFGSCL